MLVNKRQLSEILGVSERALTDWQKLEIPLPAVYAERRGQENQYDTRKVIEWIVSREIANLKVEKPKDKLYRVQAELKELELEEKRGNLAPTSLFEQAWETHIVAARMELLNLPEIAAQEISARYNVEIDVEIISELVHKALEKLSDFDVDLDEEADEDGKETEFSTFADDEDLADFEDDD